MVRYPAPGLACGQASPQAQSWGDESATGEETRMGQPQPSRRAVLPVVLVLLTGIVAASVGLSVATQVLGLLAPNHWCRDARADALRSQLPLTAAETRQFSLPAAPASAAGSDGDGAVFSQCERYADDLAGAYVLWMRDLKPPVRRDPGPVLPCDQGWHYNLTGIFPTLSSELDWVCESRWRAHATHVAFWLSAVLGAPAWAWLAHRFGCARSLLLSQSVGLLGSAGCLLPEAGYLAGGLLVAVARAAAGCPLLAAPVLCVRMLAAEVERRGDGIGAGAVAAASAEAAALVAQSAAAVGASAVAMALPSWWWLSAAVAFAQALAAFLAFWEVSRTLTLDELAVCVPGVRSAPAEGMEGGGRPQQAVEAPATEPGQGSLADTLQVSRKFSEMVRRHVTLLAAGALYAGMWYLSPRLLIGSPLRSAALLSLAECASWPLPPLLLVAEPVPAGGRGPRRFLCCLGLAVGAVLCFALAITTDRGWSVFVALALTSRMAATIALHSAYQGQAQSNDAGPLGGAVLLADACAQVALGSGAILGVLFASMADNWGLAPTVAALGALAACGAVMGLPAPPRPSCPRLRLDTLPVRVTVAVDEQEGSAKFNSSNLPYGILHNM